MKLLLVQPLSYLFSSGGAHKANRFLMEGFVEHGHECCVVSPMELEHRFEDFSITNDDVHAAMLRELSAYDAELLVADDPDCIVYRFKGVTVYAVIHDLQIFSRKLHHVLQTFQADWTIITEDRSCLWLEMALEYNASRVVYLAHSQATLPFGPESFETDEYKTAVHRRVPHRIVVSTYLQDYITRWANLSSTVIRFPSYGHGPYPFLADFNHGYITMINPSTLKGAPIFIPLAKSMPDLDFAVVPSWGTTMRERKILESMANVTFLQRVTQMDDLLRHVRVLLVPSLWGESFGQVCVDALLRGIPVIASHLGGLPEATLGVGQTIPVQPISGYRYPRSTKQPPIPLVPAQDISPWQTALRRLVSDQSFYETVAHASYAAAATFVATLGIEHFESYFRGLEAQAHSVAPSVPRAANAALLAQLSPERRAALAQRLQQTRRETV